jgi:dipeptidyl aminopeptidase/acylaminoacyl peptidase
MTQAPQIRREAAEASSGKERQGSTFDLVAEIARYPKVALCGWLEGDLLVRSDRGGTPALWIVDAMTGSFKVSLTPDAVVGAARAGKDGKDVLFELDHDGDELHQLHRVDLDRRRVTPLVVEPGIIHDLGPISPDGTAIAYASNAADSARFDVHLRGLDGSADSIVWSPGGYAFPSAFSPDGALLVVGRIGARSLETELGVVELATGQFQPISPKDPGGALWGYADGEPAVTWRPDGDSILFLTNAGREHLGIAEWNRRNRSWKYILRSDCDLAFTISNDGTLLVVAENRGGETRVSVRHSTTYETIRALELPEPGVVSDLSLSSDDRRLAFVYQSPGCSSEVWVWDQISGTTKKLTQDGSSSRPWRLASAQRSWVTSFDGERIQVLVYEPPQPRTSPPPMAIVIHGGPEMQAGLDFEPYVQALASAGFLVLRPNIRGSTGFGRRFASLDDGRRRLDALRDVIAIHDWAASTRRGDPSRTVLWGVSYGGLLANLALAHEPDRWAGAVVAVAASNIATFLAGIAPWRRPIREAEYGDLENHRAFFEEIAAVNHAERMRAPLLLVHAEHDIRVPIEESYQLRAALSGLGREPSLLVFDDDGHHFDRVENRVRFATEGVAFLVASIDSI